MIKMPMDVQKSEQSQMSVVISTRQKGQEQNWYQAFLDQTTDQRRDNLHFNTGAHFFLH